jgi:hypothetical protein
VDGAVVDFAVIDACHDTRFVINDFHKILPYMSARGLMLFHDTDPNLSEQIRQSPLKGHLATSYLACLLLRRAGHDVRHLAGTWWAIWSRQPLPGQPHPHL